MADRPRRPPWRCASRCGARGGAARGAAPSAAAARGGPGRRPAVARWLPCAGALLAFAAAREDPAAELAAAVRRRAPAGDPRAALEAFVAHSEARGLGLHLGREKGDLLEAAVRQGLPPSGPAVVFEAGGHAGDGTLSALAALAGRPGSTIVSTEADPTWLKAAGQVVRHAAAGLEVAVLHLALPARAPLDSFLDRLQEEHGISHFDAVIFDHDENSFLPHLKAVLGKGLLRQGGTVYVDNVRRKRRQLAAYIDFVSDLANGFATDVRAISDPYPDEVAVSTFLAGHTVEL